MPWLYLQHHTTFTCKEDLVQVTLASTHVPWAMDGRLCAKLRGGLALDGNFWYTVKGSYDGLVPKDGGGTVLVEPWNDKDLLQR
jgi:hypothetical protein